MPQLRGIQMLLFLTLVLLLAAVGSGHPRLHSAVTVGDDATLSCENVIKYQQDCRSTTWTYAGERSNKAVELVTLGKIGEGAGAKSVRLNVTENCSLVIQKVTEEDVGLYACQQYISDIKQGHDAGVYLSVVTMTEQNHTDDATLSCSVSVYERCRHTVRWLYKGTDVEEHNQSVRTSQSPCNSSITFQRFHFMYKERYTSLQCEVTVNNQVQRLAFRPQAREKTTTTAVMTHSTSSTEEGKERGLDSTASPVTESSNLKDWWWVLAIVAGVLLIVLLIIAVNFIIRKRTKGARERIYDNVELTSDRAGTQQDTADPEDRMSYATINHTKAGDVQVRMKNKDDEVTYSTVKASSADQVNLYATINK